MTLISLNTHEENKFLLWPTIKYIYYSFVFTWFCFKFTYIHILSYWIYDLIWFLVFNTSFSNISATRISWRPVLVVEEARLLERNLIWLCKDSFWLSAVIVIDKTNNYSHIKLLNMTTWHVLGQSQKCGSVSFICHSTIIIVIALLQYLKKNMASNLVVNIWFMLCHRKKWTYILYLNETLGLTYKCYLSTVL